MIVEATEVLNVVASAGLVAIAGGLIRWGVKVDKGLTNTVKATELLAERLNGHERVGAERHEALKDAIDRVERIALATRNGDG